MCNAETMLLAQASRAAVALTDAPFGQATDQFLLVIGNIAIGAAVVALAVVVVIAVADYISHGSTAP